MYAAHYLLGVLAAALIGFGLGAMMRGIASHIWARENTEKTAKKRGLLFNWAVVLAVVTALLGLWLFALTDLATWGQPVLGAGAVVGAALGWWCGPALRDAFTTRATYRPAGRRGSLQRRRRDDTADEPANPFASLEDDPAPPP